MGTKPIVWAAGAWLTGERHQSMPDGATVSVVDVGIAASTRTGLAHYVSDAVEITLDGETRLVARWLCGGSSTDAMTTASESVDCVNCKLAATVPQRPCVYFCWGRDTLLYVGSSTNVAQRLRTHVSQTEWWPDVERLTFVEHENEAQARRAEIQAIQDRPGVHNKLVLSASPGAGNAPLLRMVGGA